MRLIHRVFFESPSPVDKIFVDAGFEVLIGFNAFNIGEDHVEWAKIKKVINKYKIVSYIYKAEFTKEEIDNAKFLRVTSDWHFSYPQRDDDDGYFETTYKPNIGCRKCGMNLVQHNPFSIKKEPKWGKKKILYLNWVYDEFFVSGDVKNKLEGKIKNCHFMEVFKYPTSKGVHENIYQLVIENHINLLIDENTKFEICKFCKCKKYSGVPNGFFHKPQKSNFSIAKSIEYFGSGGKAYQEVIISASMRKILIEAAGVNGLVFTPCKE